jgi:hypothetical protein
MEWIDGMDGIRGEKLRSPRFSQRSDTLVSQFCFSLQRSLWEGSCEIEQRSWNGSCEIEQRSCWNSSCGIEQRSCWNSSCGIEQRSRWNGSCEIGSDGRSDGKSEGRREDGFWGGEDRMVDLMESWKVYWKLLQKV